MLSNYLSPSVSPFCGSIASNWAFGPNPNIGEITVNARKNCILILSSLMLVVAVSLASTDRLQHSQELLGNPAQTQRADGGGPVPPLPPPSFLNTLTADGGGPVPPLPPPNAASLPSLIQQSLLLRDGGGPVPPLPPPSFINTLTADGGGPVPPLPPPSLNADFHAA